jgi:hypothetical protein
MLAGTSWCVCGAWLVLEERRAGSDFRTSAGHAGGLGRGEFEQEAVGAPRLPIGTPFLATSN